MHSIAPWSNDDLFFLEDMLRRGSSFAELAGFLQRSQLEISHKAKELEVKRKRGRLLRTAAPGGRDSRMRFVRHCSS
jgi:hypothetical protein